jgi:hypothetical protein
MAGPNDYMTTGPHTAVNDKGNTYDLDRGGGATGGWITDDAGDKVRVDDSSSD